MYMHRCRKLAVMYTVAVQSASCRVLDGYACMSLPRAMQEAVEQRGLGLVCPAISFDTTVVLVTEAGLSPLELLRAILALEASAYHHNGQMSLVYLRNLLAIERLRIVDSR